jgi:N-acetylglutamate synthase-like GNAT family acetyltransferase
MVAAAGETSPIGDAVNSRALRSPFIIIMEIIPVGKETLLQTVELLMSNNLPVEDITDTVHLFVLGNSTKISGSIGIEFNNDTGLMRSLAIYPELRGRGYGKMLVAFIESFARNKRIKELYLITTTAELFFSGLYYRSIVRKSVPDFIRETSEFKTFCPASAVVMKKLL